MEIKRDLYLNQMIESMHDGLIKVITGIRRSGKSYLLDPLFTTYLLDKGVKKDHIILIHLDERRNENLYDPDILDRFLREKIVDQEWYYILLDEIQMVKDFESVLNGLLYLKNVDVFVTGSNSQFLSGDILTHFRGRSTEIRMYPLSFSEFHSVSDKSAEEDFSTYLVYGGMPVLANMSNNQKKAKYLKDLFSLTYLKDILERNHLQKSEVLENVIDCLSSSVGSLTNPKKLADTFISKGYKAISENTISYYIDCLEEAFLIEEVKRYDIKGKNYIHTPKKYYFADVGLRNARTNFRQLEEDHLMENIIYLELVQRGFNVDVGVVPINEGHSKKQLEIDFVCNQDSKRVYIQSALYLDDQEKRRQEEKSLLNVRDGFKKVIIVKGSMIPYYSEQGVLTIGLLDFLLGNVEL